MKPTLRMILAAAAATMMVTGAFAQTHSKPATTHKPAKSSTAKSSEHMKLPAGDKFWGTVTKDAIKDGKFTFGSANKHQKGSFVVDTTGAKITDKAGKSFTLSSLKPGSSVTVFGKATKNAIKANAVIVNYVPGTKPATSASSPKSRSAKTTSAKSGGRSGKG